MPKRNTSGLMPPVRTTEQARALAAHGAGRPASSRPLKPWSGKLYADQLEELSKRGVNASELIRRLLDEHLSRPA